MNMTCSVTNRLVCPYPLWTIYNNDKDEIYNQSEVMLYRQGLLLTDQIKFFS